MSTQRVYLHVGVPKSGTTFLQASLAQNRPALREAGLMFPGPRAGNMFRATVDMRGIHESWGLTHEQVDGMWAQICGRVRAFDGNAVMSNELLGAATPEQIDAALGHLEGAELHVVVTARDPGRQVTAEWQEGVKHGRKATFEEFRERVFDPAREHEHASRFWASHDIPALLARWADFVPASRVHVVCSPASSADRGELWRRFAGVVGFDPEEFPPADGRQNPSLGTTQIDLLRRVNRALDGRLRQPHYGRVVKRGFAQKVLAAHGSARPSYPSQMYGDLLGIARTWLEHIAQAGYQVHGELGDLLPSPPAHDAPHPDEVEVGQEIDTASAVIADLLVEMSRMEAAQP